MYSLSETSSPFVPIKEFSKSAGRIFLFSILGIGFIGLGAHLDIPMIPVPMSMQTYAVLVIGALSGWRLGGFIVISYIAAAAAGVPLFSGGASGVAHLMGPTAGYIWGFVIAALLTGYLAEKCWTLDLLRSTATMLIGHILILVPGTLWLAKSMGFSSALEKGLLPFLLGAFAKSVFAAITIFLLIKIRKA